MARVRSRQVETESVNQRMLRRGAVKRQHISRWAIGHSELAPGVVGDIHIHPTLIERIRELAAGTGVGEMMIVAAEGATFADGGGYVEADSIVYRHGFVDNTAPGDTVLWPTGAVGEIQVEFKWDTYEGGGTIEIEVDGTVPAWGLIATGTSGREGCKRRTVHIAEGSSVKVKVTQDSGVDQVADVLVEFSIPDPAQSLAGGGAGGFSYITDTFTRDGSLASIDGRLTETGDKTWDVTDGSTFPMASGGASAVDPGIPLWVGMGVAHLDAGFSNGIIHADVTPLAESNDPPFRNGLVFRYVDDLNFWAFFNYRNFAGVLGYFLRSYVAGVITDDFGFMHDGARDTGGPIPLDVVLDGPIINAYYDGVLRVSTTSSTHLTATEHGICTYGDSVSYFSAISGLET